MVNKRPLLYKFLGARCVPEYRVLLLAQFVRRSSNAFVTELTYSRLAAAIEAGMVHGRHLLY